MEKLRAVLALLFVLLLTGCGILGLGGGSDDGEAAETTGDAAEEAAVPTATKDDKGTEGEAAATPSSDETAEAEDAATPSPEAEDLADAADESSEDPTGVVSREGLTFSNDNAFVDADGRLHVVGVVTNEAAFNIEYPTVIVDLIDAEGEIINAAYSITPITVLLPGSSSPFEVIFPDGGGEWDDYALSAEGRSTGRSTIQYFNIDTTLEDTNPIVGVYALAGEVINIAQSDSPTTVVVGTFYDSSDRVVAVRSAYVEGNPLLSGESGRFSLVVPGAGGTIESYVLQVEGQTSAVNLDGYAVPDEYVDLGVLGLAGTESEDAEVAEAEGEESEQEAEGTGTPDPETPAESDEVAEITPTPTPTLVDSEATETDEENPDAAASAETTNESLGDTEVVPTPTFNPFALPRTVRADGGLTFIITNSLLRVTTISESKYYITSGLNQLNFIGLVANNGSAPVQGTTVVVDLLDSKGNLIDSSFASLFPVVLRSGQNAPFRVTFTPQPVGWQTYRITAYSVTTRPTLESANTYRFDGLSAGVPAYGAYAVSGTVTNTGPAALIGTRVMGVFYDGNNQIVGAAYTPPIPYSLEPGQGAPFTVNLGNAAGAVARYELVAVGYTIRQENNLASAPYTPPAAQPQATLQSAAP